VSKLVLLSGEPVRYLREDGGYTLRYFLSDPRVDRAFNVVLQSNEEGDKRKPPLHSIAREFAGKRVRVTVEVIE
jgi:hypothetical protein